MRTTGFAILNTRPAKQGKTFAQLVEAAGGRAYACPALQIETLPWQVSRETSIAPLWLFTSVNALSSVADGLAKLDKVTQASIQLLPIGQATEAAIRAQLLSWQKQAPQLTFHLLHSAQTSVSNSEALLQHEALQLASLQKQAVWLFKGEGGRTLLQDALAQQGCAVTEWSLYRRISAPFCQQAWSSFIADSAPFKTILATSVQSLQGLWQGWHQWQQVHDVSHETINISNLPLIVFSPRIADFAQAEGWQGKIWVTPQTSNQGIIEVINAVLKEKDYE